MSDHEIPGPAAAAPSRRARWVLLLVLLVVFVSGGIVGGVSTDSMHRSGWMRLRLRPGEVPDRLVPMLRGKLDLSDEQTTQVDKIVRDRHREIEKLRAEVQPRIDSQIDQMQSEIDAVLNTEQRDRWHDWVESLRHRWGPDHHPHHHHHEWAGHGGRPPHFTSPDGKPWSSADGKGRSSPDGKSWSAADGKAWAGRGCPSECRSKAAYAAAAKAATEPAKPEQPAAETKPANAEAAPAAAEPEAAKPAAAEAETGEAESVDAKTVDAKTAATPAAKQPATEAAPAAKTDP